MGTSHVQEVLLLWHKRAQKVSQGLLIATYCYKASVHIVKVHRVDQSQDFIRTLQWQREEL